MALELTPQTRVTRDPAGRVLELDHSLLPVEFHVGDEGAEAVRRVAQAYLRETAPIFGFTPEDVEPLDAAAPSGEPTDAGSRLRFRSQREIAGLAVVHYVQTHFGLPVWNTGIGLRISTRSLGVVGASRQTLDGLAPLLPNLEEARFAPRRITPERLAEALGLDGFAGPAEINDTSLLIYRFFPEARQHTEIGLDPNEASSAWAPPYIALPPLDAERFPAGSDWVVTSVLFTTSPLEGREMNWRVFLEPKTGAVLYLRPLTAAVCGRVFRIDPVTDGCCTCNGNSTDTELDVVRSLEPLLGLETPAPGDCQALRGEYVTLEDTDPPPIKAPTQPIGKDFDYQATTNDFSAVNAYYHCDAAFRLIAELGFDVPSYFQHTAFPIPVDFRGNRGASGAWCDGNKRGDGTARFRFGLVRAGRPVGIATDFRVVWHELGHALLWDHVAVPNLEFAHSPGDALAAIYADPDSRAKDRWITFPFTGQTNGWDRRHDRTIGRWAWFGHEWNAGYNGEQILSTSLFRAYRASGGDSSDPRRKLFASRYLIYLIVKACGLLTQNPRDPRVLVTALQEADWNTCDFRGEAGGTASKILRWSFEQQGLYQAASTPTPYTAPGLPPENDLYIDDGRDGGYLPWLDDWTMAPGVWNRLAQDGGTSSQKPAPGQENYLYVCVRNRGTAEASGVTVRAFQSRPGGAGDWPGDWLPTKTVSRAASGPLPPGGREVVGPFTWRPGGFAGESVLVAASNVDDPAVIDNPQTVCATIPNWRLVPCDNNMAQWRF